ncbi:MAG: DUF4153 domain-containing protein [Pontixanthobacter sp.]
MTTPESSPSESASVRTINRAVPDDWALRPWLIASLLGIAGLAVHLASDGGEDVPWRMALTALCFFAPFAAAFTIDRDFRIPPVIFSLGVGLVMAGIAWRATNAGDRYSDEAYWIASGILAITLAVPLFQAGFHRKRMATSYADTHYFVWTDVISGAGSFAFLGLSWALIAILSELFQLIKIDLLKDLLNEQWFGWIFSGVAFGAALGTLRNQLKILATLQSVVLLVLSLLAVPLAAALVIFLLAMAVSGPDVLWEATRSATPVLLAIAVGAFILTNAVIRDQDAGTSGSRVLRIAALILALGIFPLTVFAAVSMGTRIAQHGLSPERIWALIAIAVATAYGFAYLAGVVRGRKNGWRDNLRQSNLHLAVIVAVLALLLAMPILNFGAISTGNQLARLESGAVSAKDFDYSALRWDFGEPGREALVKLAKSDSAEISKGAKIAQTEEYRRYRSFEEPQDESDKRMANLRMEFDDPALRERVELTVAAMRWTCDDPCVALDAGETGGLHLILLVEGQNVRQITVDPAKPLDEMGGPAEAAELYPAYDAADKPKDVTAKSKVEIREWRGRKIFVDGKPVGEPFE